MISLTLLFVAILSFGESAKRMVPFRFKRVRDQSIRWIHLHIAATRQIGLVACPFELLAVQSVALVRAALKFFLYRQRDLKRDRRDWPPRQPAHSLVNLTTLKPPAPPPP